MKMSRLGDEVLVLGGAFLDALCIDFVFPTYVPPSFPALKPFFFEARMLLRLDDTILHVLCILLCYRKQTGCDLPQNRCSNAEEAKTLGQAKALIWPWAVCSSQQVGIFNDGDKNSRCELKRYESSKHFSGASQKASEADVADCIKVVESPAE